MPAELFIHPNLKKFCRWLSIQSHQQRLSARRADTGTSTTLLSICDLPAPHPRSECKATMEESKGEGGRLQHYSGVCWKYTSSRVAHSIQATKVWENLLARCFTRGCCRWKLFCLLYWVGKKKIIIIKKKIKVKLHVIRLLSISNACEKKNLELVIIFAYHA